MFITTALKSICCSAVVSFENIRLRKRNVHGDQSQRCQDAHHEQDPTSAETAGVYELASRKMRKGTAVCTENIIRMMG